MSATRSPVWQPSREEIAEKALELIEVEYEPLPGVFDPEFGAGPEAPLLHPDLGKYEVVNFIFPEPGTNISNHFRIRKGDVDGSLDEVRSDRRAQVPHPAHPARADRAACRRCQSG